jgi:hypothetical protein
MGTTALAEYWPKNGGALGKWKSEFLMPGMEIDRFGSGFGKYFSPVNMNTLLKRGIIVPIQ